MMYRGESFLPHLTAAHKEKALSFHHHFYTSPSQVRFINTAVGMRKRAAVPHMQVGAEAHLRVTPNTRVWTASADREPLAPTKRKRCSPHHHRLFHKARVSFVLQARSRRVARKRQRKNNFWESQYFGISCSPLPRKGGERKRTAKLL